MADETKDEGGFDLLKLVKGGLRSAGLKGGKWVIGRALNALGLPVGDQTRRMLAEIQAELDIIADNVVAIRNGVEQLTSDLRIDVADLQSQTGLQSILGPMSTIESKMIQLCSMIGGASDCQRLSTYTSGYGPAAKQTVGAQALTEAQAFAQNVLVTWDIATQMQTIRNGLLGSAPTVGIIDSFVDLGIKRMDAKQVDLPSWYAFVEQSFLEWVTELQYGMILMVNAQSIDVGPDQDATAAIGWIDSSYKPMLNDVVETFAGAVERMILSRYDSLADGPAVSFVSDAEMSAILLRVDLLSMLLLSDDDAPGFELAMRQFIRGSQVQGNGGPALQPPGAAATNGTLMTIPSRYRGGGSARMAHWYKCIDFLDAEHLELASFENSDIRTVRYRWSGAGTPGQPLSTSGLFANVVPRWYDKATLAVTDGSSNSVLFASWTTAAPILENLYFTSAVPVPAAQDNRVHVWEYESFVNPDPDQSKDAKELLQHKVEEIDFVSVPHACRSGFTIPTDHSLLDGSGPAQHKFKVKRNFHYRDGAARPMLHVFHSATAVAENDHRNSYSPSTGLQDGETPPASTLLELKVLRFDSYKNDKDKHDDAVTSVFLEKSAKSFRVDKKWSMALEAGWYYTLQWRVYLTAERQHTGRTGWYHDKTTIAGSWSVGWVRLAWEQPTLL